MVSVSCLKVGLSQNWFSNCAVFTAVMVQVSLFTGVDYWTDLFASRNHFYAL